MSEVRTRTGLVTQTAPLRVRVDGEATEHPVDLPRLSTYTPVVSDWVLMVLTGRQLIVLGKVVAD